MIYLYHPFTIRMDGVWYILWIRSLLVNPKKHPITIRMDGYSKGLHWVNKQLATQRPS